MEATEIDDAVIARLSVERIRLRAQGRDTYVQAMIRWVQTLEPARDEASPSVDPLARELKARDALGRVLEGSRALGVIKAAEGVPAIVAKRGDGNWASLTGVYLSRALARIGVPLALESLGQELSYSDRKSLAAMTPLEPDEPDVAWAYWQMRTQGMNQGKAIDTLTWTVLNGPLHFLYAERVLDLIGRPAVPALIAALGPQRLGTHPEAPQRLAVHVLGTMRAPEAVGALRSLLHTASVELRPRIAWAIGEIRDESALPDLMEAAAHPVQRVRQAAIRALGALGSSVAEELMLTVAGNDPVRSVRSAAVTTLSVIGTRMGGAALEALAPKEMDEALRTRMLQVAARLRSK